MTKTKTGAQSHGISSDILIESVIAPALWKCSTADRCKGLGNSIQSNSAIELIELLGRVLTLNDLFKLRP